MGRTGKLLISVLIFAAFLAVILLLYPAFPPIILMSFIVPAVLAGVLTGAKRAAIETSLAALIIFATFALVFRYDGNFNLYFAGSTAIAIFTAYTAGRQRDLKLAAIAELNIRREIEKERDRQKMELEVYTEKLKAEIEERFHAEKVHKESEKLYRDLVDKAGIGILACDNSGALTFCNGMLCSIFGYAFEEIVFMPIIEIIHPDDRGRITAPADDLSSSPAVPGHHEFKGLRKDGSVIACEIDTVVIEKAGKITGTRSYLRDISKRKKIETELNLNEKRFRGIYEHANVGMYRLRPDGTVVLINPELTSMLRYGGEKEIIGRNFNFHFQDLERRIEFYGALMDEGKVTGHEEEWSRRDGTIFFGRENAWAVYDEDGRLTFFDGIVEDITSRKQADEEREKLIEQLMNAKSEIKVLSGLLPICSSCKRIRDDQGQWAPIEQFIDEHSEAEFSHGICPECASKLFPNYMH